MEITTVTRYKLLGKEYNSLNKCKEDIENQIGEIIDDIFNICPPAKASGKLKVLEFITKKENRDKLIRLLSITFQTEYIDDSYLSGKIINILDL